ncbi:proton channel OtopLc-like isoform X2 [Amphibalanus amphitrite]|uniref:proton channel OtopLc-like isoform X2 n=1 Tax=Amphibalanus amphitrite TaxID=1232801 RepID=UPI001C922564|nr:proton channel OtopLc-like isoform X2 [Amphibalanus amphitrite]
MSKAVHFVAEEPGLVVEEAPGHSEPAERNGARVSPPLRVRVRLLETPDREERRRVVDQWWHDWRDGKLPAVYYRTMPRYPYLQEMKDKLLNSSPKAEMEDTTTETVELGETPVSIIKVTPDRCVSSPVERPAPPLTPSTACFRILSLVYAKLLVVVCIAFLISEIITDSVPLYFYEAFFTYLYGVSILFLLYVLVYLLHESSTKVGKQQEGSGCCGKKAKPPADVNLNDGAGGGGGGSPERLTRECRPYKTKTSDNEHSHGGFFLRIGAIAFGLGTMVYNGLELGTFFEIPEDSECWQILMAVNPCLQATFTFMQMYFIFMNSRLNIHKFKVVARCGLMHVVATNVCVWLRTVVRESLRVYTDHSRATGGRRTEDFLILDPVRRLGRRLLQYSDYDSDSDSADYGSGVLVNDSALDALLGAGSVASVSPTEAQDGTTMSPIELVQSVWSRPTQPPLTDVLGTTDGDPVAAADNFTCGRVNIMGAIVRDASPYLFPLMIEYSLIGAAVLYIMWQNIGRCPRYLEEDDIPDHVSVTSRKAHTKVDCIGASKGLFCGLLVLVAAIICLVLYFVLIEREEYEKMAIFLADTSHAGILFLMLLATLVGFIRNRKLKFAQDKPDELDAILQRVSGFGLFLYSVFCVISAALSPLPHVPNLLVLITSSLVILQVLFQLLYVADVSKRAVYLPEHDLSKPGRQVVTFLLLCNIALWVVYTFEIRKVEADPVQLNFYGPLHWAVLLRVTLPLAIFHRFHSAVVLAEVWKSSYKARAD